MEIINPLPNYIRREYLSGSHIVAVILNFDIIFIILFFICNRIQKNKSIANIQIFTSLLSDGRI